MNLSFRIFRAMIYVPAFILFFRWIANGIRGVDPELGIALPGWSRSIGIVFMAIGGILVLFCVIIFVIRGKGTPAVFDPPTEFVATGPYAYVRNPMYIGGFILLAGFGFYQYSLSILILSVVLLVLFHFFVVFIEEPTLEKQFGKSYLDYKGHINRWIPKWN